MLPPAACQATEEGGDGDGWLTESDLLAESLYGGAAAHDVSDLDPTVEAFENLLQNDTLAWEVAEAFERDIFDMLTTTTAVEEELRWHSVHAIQLVLAAAIACLCIWYVAVRVWTRAGLVCSGGSALPRTGSAVPPAPAPAAHARLTWPHGMSRCFF